MVPYGITPLKNSVKLTTDEKLINLYSQVTVDRRLWTMTFKVEPLTEIVKRPALLCWSVSLLRNHSHEQLAF